MTVRDDSPEQGLTTSQTQRRSDRRQPTARGSTLADTPSLESVARAIAQILISDAGRRTARLAEERARTK
jgi:hypothetical protein